MTEYARFESRCDLAQISFERNIIMQPSLSQSAIGREYSLSTRMFQTGAVPRLVHKANV